MKPSPAPPAPGGRNFHPRYRPDIDGMRALAVLAVVTYHAFPYILLGGFAGVDVFFVISGFLISRIIFQSLQDGDFSFSEFYAHRVRRIFPALILVLAACFAFGWFALLPDEYRQLGKHIASGAGFVSNFTLYFESGYFDTDSEWKPLLHLWSLSVEEQFYALYPLLIWAAWRVRLNVLAVVAALGLLSVALNLHEVGANASLAFFLPHTRYWELFVGALLAWHSHYGPDDALSWLKRMVYHPALTPQPPPAARQEAALNNALSATGLALVIFSFLALDRSTPYPGGWALLPVVGAALIIFAGGSAWLNARLLAWRPLVFIGLISYPLYLWHWPLLAFARILNEPPAWTLPLAFVLAWLTYRLVERPIRFSPPGWAKTLALCAAMAGIGGIGGYAWHKDGLPLRPPIQALAAYHPDNFEWESRGLIRDEDCHKRFPFSRDRICKIAKETPPTVVLLGDSHANALYPGLAEATATDADVNVLNLGAPGTIPFAGLESGPRTSTPQALRENALLIEQALAYAETAPTVRTVILASRGPLYISGRFPLTPDESPPDFILRLPGQPGISDNREIWRAALRSTLARLLKSGKQVVIVLDVAELGFNPKTLCVEHRPLRFSAAARRSPCAVSRSKFEERSRDYRELTTSVLKEFPTVKVFDASAPFCDAQWCRAMLNDTVMYRDGDHLSLHGSRLAAKTLAQLLKTGLPEPGMQNHSGRAPP
jgi:peptidoglycan/LPS O-acetylase OafA/YrhL